MTALEEVDLDDLQLEPLDSLNLEVRGVDDLLKTVKSLSNKAGKRQEAAARSAALQARAAAALGADQEAAWEQEAAAGPAQQAAAIQEMQRKMDDTLQEDAAAVQPEPPLHECVVLGVRQQDLPPLEISGLPQLQQLLHQHQQLLASGPPAASSSQQADKPATGEALSQAFTWLLQDCEQLAACPSEAMAQAVFRAAWCGGPQLAAAATRRFLAWCGLWELQAAADAAWPATADAMALAAAGAASFPAAAASRGWCQQLHLSQQQPAVTVQWLPCDADFLEAFRALGCSTDGNSSAKASSRKQQQPTPAAAAAAAAGDGTGGAGQQPLLPFPAPNLRLLLQLLTQLCRLAAAGRLSLQLGVGGKGQQLARLLLRLQLDARVVVGCPGAAEAAAGALLEVVGSSDWSRLVPQLLEALAGGLGPSYRSSVLLMSQLPLTDRGILLRQQGALLLLNKLMPGTRPAQQASRSTTKPDVRQLVALLGGRPGSSSSDAERSVQSAVRHLLEGVMLPGSGKAAMASGNGSSSKGSSGGGSSQAVHDYWRLLNIADAANLLLWVDLATPGAGADDKVRRWFITWMELLERELSKKLDSHRVRSRLTELINMCTFAAQLPGCCQGCGAAAGDADDFD